MKSPLLSRACALTLLEAANIYLPHAYVTLKNGNYANVFHLLHDKSCITWVCVEMPTNEGFKLAL